MRRSFFRLFPPSVPHPPPFPLCLYRSISFVHFRTFPDDPLEYTLTMRRRLVEFPPESARFERGSKSNPTPVLPPRLFSSSTQQRLLLGSPTALNTSQATPSRRHHPARACSSSVRLVPSLSSNSASPPPLSPLAAL